MDRWVDGQMGLRAILRIAYSNKNVWAVKKFSPGWMGGWMVVKAVLRIAYSNKN